MELSLQVFIPPFTGVCLKNGAFTVSNQINEKFITCSCGSSDHIMRLRSFLWRDKDDKHIGIDLAVEIILNPEYTLANRIIAAIKYIFCYKSQNSHFADIIIDDKNIDDMIDFLNDFKQKKNFLNKI